MNIKRIFSFGLDPQTREHLCGVMAHPLQSAYRLCRFLASDADLEKRTLLRNLAMSLPDRAAGDFSAEIEFLSRFPRDASSMFPYPIVGKEHEVDSGFDNALKLPYVVHRGRRFYSPADVSPEAALSSYRYFTEEEGLLGGGIRAKSPHCYTSSDFHVEEGDVVVDVGCSDALFAFDNAERASKIYLFESWSRWKKALEASFAPFNDKTLIFDKLVANTTGKDHIRLEDAVKEPAGARYFLKMDIEGGERTVIEASCGFLQANKVKLSCCAYHRQDDAEYLMRLLEGMGFRCRFSEGYMLPLFNGIHFPYFRRGVIYAQNYE